MSQAPEDMNYETVEEIQSRIASAEAVLQRNTLRVPVDAVLETLAENHFELYRQGKREHLDEAIKNAQEAVEESTGDDFFYEKRLSMLTQYLLERGERPDIEQAIDNATEYVTTSTKQSNKPHWLWLLASSRVMQFTWSGDMRQLNAAIRAARESLFPVYTGQPGAVGRLMTLSQCLRERFLRTNNIKNLDEAIGIVQMIIEDPPKGEGSLNDPGQCLQNLSILLVHRYEHTEKENYLNDAIDTAQRAVDNTPVRYPTELAARLNHLAVSLATRYRHTANLADLDKAINKAQEAVDRTAIGLPERDHLLDTVATALSDRYDQTHTEEDRVMAIRHSESVFRSRGIMPLRRLSAARQAMRLHAVKGEYEKASELAEKALEILPLVCSRYLSQADQQYAVLQVSGLAADACSLLLKADLDPARAVEILEHGRGLILGYLIDGRRDLTALRKADRRLADRFGKVRAKSLKVLPQAYSGRASSSTARSGILEDVEEIAASLEGCLRDIRRKVKGFERFLLPPLSETLVCHSVNGPIVLVNVTEISSDALLVRPMQAITRLELPDLSARQVKTYRRASGLDLTTRGAGSGTGSGMRGAPPDTARQQDKRDRRFLAHLWTNCVRLVLDKLGVLVNQPTPSSAAVTADLLPRVWWIGTGLASALPFHAAGIHSNEAAHVGENAFAYVISSYTPSIKALGFARERAVATIPKPIEQRGLSPAAGDVLVSEQENKLMGLQTEHDKHQSLLLVTMPETPGMWNLSGVDQEQTKITDALRLAASKAVGTEATASSTTILKSQPQVMRQPSAKAVLHALRSHSIVHFACHGASDLLDPSKSFLALQPHPFSGSTKSSTSTQSSPNRPRQPDKLTVHEIAESRLRRSWLAYLSACSTAENQVAELADEALHLASGFQVAGYAHTIAAMWPSNDAICAEVAGAFYAELLANWDPDRSSRLNSPARALQAAVGGIRARNIDRPSLWAQYIHMGA